MNQIDYSDFNSLNVGCIESSPPVGQNSFENVVVPTICAKAAVIGLKGIKCNSLLPTETTPIKFRHILALAKMYYEMGEEGQLHQTWPQQKECFQRAFNLLERTKESRLRRITRLFDLTIKEYTNTTSLPYYSSSTSQIDSYKIRKVERDVEDFFSVDLSKVEQLYLIGHRLALEEAVKAAQNRRDATLCRAYALDAFACHFLTELFIPGYLINQRSSLESFLSGLHYSATEAKGYATFLTAIQCTNAKRLIESENYCRAEKNGISTKVVDSKVKEAIQRSSDEVYKTFCDPSFLNRPYSAYVKKRDGSQLFHVVENRLFICRRGQKVEISSRSEFENIAIPYTIKSLLEYYRYDYHLLNCYLFYMGKRLSLTLPKKTQLSLSQNTRIHTESRKYIRAYSLQSERERYETVRPLIERAKSILENSQLMSTIENIELMCSIEHPREYFTVEEMENKIFQVALCLEKILREGSLVFTDERDPLEFTLWFRDMLDYQERVHKLYLAKNGYGMGDREIDEEIFSFTNSIEQQIERYAEHLVQDVIYLPLSTYMQQWQSAKEFASFMHTLDTMS